MLVAVLTQQKYNDAAVKQFFRAAVEADKPIIVVFNQCDLEADRDYWPQWLDTFCQADRRAAGIGLRGPLRSPRGRGVAAAVLCDLHRRLRESAGGERQPCGRGADAKCIGRQQLQSPVPNPQSIPSPADLRDDLAALHFDAIKIRTFRGALRRVLDPAARRCRPIWIRSAGGRRVFRRRRGPVGHRNGAGRLALAARRRAGR